MTELILTELETSLLDWASEGGASTLGRFYHQFPYDSARKRLESNSGPMSPQDSVYLDRVLSDCSFSRLAFVDNGLLVYGASFNISAPNGPSPDLINKTVQADSYPYEFVDVYYTGRQLGSVDLETRINDKAEFSLRYYFDAGEEDFVVFPYFSIYTQNLADANPLKCIFTELYTSDDCLDMTHNHTLSQALSVSFEYGGADDRDSYLFGRFASCFADESTVFRNRCSYDTLFRFFGSILSGSTGV